MQSHHLLKKLLGVTFVFIAVLIMARIWYTGTWRHVFLIWNIFLAWIPFAVSNYFAQYAHKQRWKQATVFCTWLLFFPNALYIVTDLVHLQDNGNAPLWFDVILLFTSSLAGLVLAFSSLNNAEKYLQMKFSKRLVAILMPCILFISSYGVYLGRFRRWNSWDVVQSPLALAEDIMASILFPADHIRTWAVTVTLTLLFSLIYAFTRIISIRPDKKAGH